MRAHDDRLMYMHIRRDFKSLLVRLLGFPATLIHGDTLVLDRWIWLRKRLNELRGERLLDVGCGSGAFTIGAALRGYRSLGLSWDQRNQIVAVERAKLCDAPLATFDVTDVRRLDLRDDLSEQFDVVICCENIEHILDDEKLMRDMAQCLKVGGVLLLTTPNFDYRPITKEDNGPFSSTEDGRHVRRGYTKSDLERLCSSAGLCVRSVGFCSGFLSQKLTALMRTIGKINKLLGWAAILPLRWLPPLVDNRLSSLLSWPSFSITLEAVRPEVRGAQTGSQPTHHITLIQSRLPDTTGAG